MEHTFTLGKLFCLGLCLSHLGEDVAKLFTFPLGTNVSSQLEIHIRKKLYTTEIVI